MLDIGKKDEILGYFEQDVELADSSMSFSLLNPIKETHNYLYKIGCKLDTNYKNKDVINTMIGGIYIVSAPEYCGLLNEWLEKKKITYINEGPNCENSTILWEEIIEKLWEQLKNHAFDSFSCDRNKTIYNCHVSTELKSALSVGFTLMGIFLITLFIFYKFSPLGPRIRNRINNKRRTTQNIAPEVSGELLEISSENEISHCENGRFCIGYHSVKNW
ncbi:PIR protein, pseudogene [Plasmodium malariae]|nr:PIR protein, pseudogene [Plasmodium malariae]SBT86415.1 PIR protein, pseudogene [Plasmodium malariae]